MSNSGFDFWMFFAGLGIFLFGMRHLEDGIKGLTGKAFKQLLKRFTGKTWKGILTGAGITAILQSSSMVTLLVLAFLGSGILGLKSSLGIILGANLGTTITAWIVATLGFKMNIADFSFPFLAVGILSYLFLNSRPILKNLGGFLVGFGLLFLGLDFMKDAIESLAEQLDLNLVASYGLWAFLLVGIVVTALLQSSSALIVIILSALNAELIDIYSAVAMVIGANIGTTATMVIGALGGTSDKKRLALAHVTFNVVTGTLLFFFIRQLVDVTYYFFGIEDRLMELVLLNTLLNLIMIVLFYPFIPAFTRFLKSRFVSKVPQGRSLFIQNIPPEVPDVAIQALGGELRQVYDLTRAFINDCFQIGRNAKSREFQWKTIFSTATNLTRKYEEIKSLEDELTGYYAVIQEKNLSPEEAARLTSGIMALRSLIYSAKDVKDIMHNIRFILDSDDEFANKILLRLKDFVDSRFQKIEVFLEKEEFVETSAGIIQTCLEENEEFYEKSIQFLYENISHKKHLQVPVSTLTNMIRQSVSSMNNLCNAILYWKFGQKAAREQEY